MEHFKIKWGQLYLVGIMFPVLIEMKLMDVYKNKWGQIPTVPICSAGPASYSPVPLAFALRPLLRKVWRGTKTEINLNKM